MIKIFLESDKFSHKAGVTKHGTNSLARKSHINSLARKSHILYQWTVHFTYCRLLYTIYIVLNEKYACHTQYLTIIKIKIHKYRKQNNLLRSQTVNVNDQKYNTWSIEILLITVPQKITKPYYPKQITYQSIFCWNCCFLLFIQRILLHILWRHNVFIYCHMNKSVALGDLSWIIALGEFISVGITY